MNWYLREELSDRIETVYGYAVRSMVYLKSPNTTPEERMKILTDVRTRQAFSILNRMPAFTSDDVQVPQSPKLVELYKSRPIFHATTDMLTKMMPAAKGENAGPTQNIKPRMIPKK